MVAETLSRFLGEIQQIPTAFSACKVDGARAYELLRQLSNEPTSIKLSEKIDFEVRPANDDDRVIVGCGSGLYRCELHLGRPDSDVIFLSVILN